MTAPFDTIEIVSMRAAGPLLARVELRQRCYRGHVQVHWDGFGWSLDVTIPRGRNTNRTYVSRAAAARDAAAIVAPFTVTA